MSIGTPEEVHEIRLKRGRPIGSKDVTPRKRRTQINMGTPEEVHEIRLKCRRPIGSKDVIPRKRRTQMSIGTLEEVHDKKKKNNSQGQLAVLVGDLNINMLSLQCIYENSHSNIGVYIYIF